MATYTVRYETTLYYEVQVEAENAAEARKMVRSEIGNHEEYEISSEITEVIG